MKKSLEKFLCSTGKKVAAIAVLVALTAGIAAGCGSTQDKNSGSSTGTANSQAPAEKAETKNIVFQDWTIPAKDVIDAQIEAFKKVNPNVKVTLEVLPYADYWSKIPIAIAGGAGPDIFVMTRPNFDFFAKSNQAADLTEEVQKSAALQKNLAQMNPIFVNTYQYKGKTMGIPFGLDSVAIVYNKNLLEKEGIKLPSEIENTWTWNDLRDYAAKLTKRSGNEVTQYGFVVPVHRLPTFEFMWSNGGELFVNNGEECTYASSQNIQAIQFLTDLMLKDKVSPTPSFVKTTNADELFMSGKVAMMVAGSATMPTYISKIKDFEWDYAQIPISPNSSKRAITSNVLGYIVGPNTKVKKEVVQFLEHLTTPESQKVFAEKGVFIPVRKDAQEPFFSASKPKNIKALQKALEYSRPMAFTEWVAYPDVISVTQSYLEQIYSGNISVKDGWKAAQDELNAKIKENKAKSK